MIVVFVCNYVITSTYQTVNKIDRDGGEKDVCPHLWLANSNVG